MNIGNTTNIDSAEPSIRYPIDMSIEEQSDYIRFQFFRYKPPLERTTEDPDTGVVGTTAGYLKGYYGEEGEGSIGTKASGDILMYMPQDVSTSMASSWGGKEISNVAAGALSAYANATNLELGDAVKSIQDGIRNLAGAPTSAGAALVKMGLSATGAQANLSQNDILGGTSGIILNPNTEVLFGGPSIRNIGFKFKMMARSEKEAIRMLRICRKFQYHAAPRMGTNKEIEGKILKNTIALTTANTGGLFAKTDLDKKKSAEDLKGFTQVNNFIQLPDLCLFKYMTGPNVNPYLNQYKACALTNVDVNFTPDGSYSTLIGGYPSAVELSISLVETKIIYKSEINPDLGVSN